MICHKTIPHFGVQKVPDVASVLVFEFDFVGKSVQRPIGDRNVALSQIEEDPRVMNVARMLHGYPDVVRVHETKKSRDVVYLVNMPQDVTTGLIAEAFTINRSGRA